MTFPESFQKRRARHLIITAIAAGFMVQVIRDQRERLSNSAFSTGYLLLALVVFLMAFHWRKKITFLPIGSASTWMQLHIYLALLTAPLFGLHVQWSLPDGWFEGVLAAMFALTFTSGVWGLYLTRTYPRRLAQCHEQYLFERIPASRHQLLDSTRGLILQTVEQHGTTTLADFYHRQLAGYFEQTRGAWFHLLPNTRMRRDMTQDLVNLRRYLSEAELSVTDELFQRIRRKDELDYQYALQWMLKSWLVVHLALSYSLVLCVVWHVIMAHAFHGGWR